MAQDPISPQPNKPSMPCPFDGGQCRPRCGMWAWLDKEKKLGGCANKIAIEYLHAIHGQLEDIKNAIIINRKM